MFGIIIVRGVVLVETWGLFSDLVVNYEGRTDLASQGGSMD